jgi:hypothetical protein
MLIENFDFIFWKTVENIKKVLVLDDDSIASMLLIKPSHYQKLQKRNKLPSLSSLDKLTSRLGLNLNSLFSEQIDYMRLRERFYGNVYALPTRYDYGKLSKSRTIINCLDYLSIKYNDNVKYTVLGQLQIDPLFFEDDDRTMNINVISDLCTFLKKSFHFEKEDFMSLGRWSYQVNKDNELGKKLSSYNKAPDMFNAICKELSTAFEKNFDYDLKSISGNTVTIQSRPSEEAQDLLRSKLVGNSTTCLTKMGVLSSFSQYLSLPAAKVEKTKCMYQGDKITEYEIII